MKEAIQSKYWKIILECQPGAAHMIEADVLLYDNHPVMAHPPETNSDNTLKEWLNEIKNINKGIKLDFKSLAMVQEMAELCRDCTQPITFAVRADLVCRSKSELLWLLQQSNRYTLTIWTGKDDEYSVDDLLFIRRSFDKCRKS
ncbi:hypothetical protein L345_08084, partial [Ophiophagus hannah]